MLCCCCCHCCQGACNNNNTDTLHCVGAALSLLPLLLRGLRQQQHRRRALRWCCVVAVAIVVIGFATATARTPINGFVARSLYFSLDVCVLFCNVRFLLFNFWCLLYFCYVGWRAALEKKKDQPQEKLLLSSWSSWASCLHRSLTRVRRLYYNIV